MNNLISINELIKELEIEQEKLEEYLKLNEIEVFYILDEGYILEEKVFSIYESLKLKTSIVKEEDVVLEQTKGKYDERNKLNNLTGSEWMPETKSFWYQKGLGKSHPHAQIEKLHPAPFSFQDISRLIGFFTKENDLVLDPFLGVGSTLKSAALLKRKGVGIELSEEWSELAVRRLETEVGEGVSREHEIITGDSRNVLDTLENDSIDFIVTSPPYWSILNKKPDHKVKERVDNELATNYSDSDDDLGNIENYEIFLKVLINDIFKKCGRILKPDKYMAIVVSDFRHKSEFISFHSDLIQGLNKLKINKNYELRLQGVKALLQNHKSLLPYGYPFAYVENIHHQYILIFRKVKVKKSA